MSKSLTLKKNEDRRILSGHLWIFSNEIESIEGNPELGDIVELKSHSGKFLGVGFYNPHSLIAFRLLSRHEVEIDENFFKIRIENALALRRKLYPDAETFRVVHGESDFLPGLVVDKYNEYLSVQTFSAGMEQRLTIICNILEDIFHPKGIVERNETPMRKLETLEQRKGILRGTVEPVLISENGIKYLVDLMEGQKTGFFLDQRENRKAFRRYVAGANVLDVCCNDGGFALNAAAHEQAQRVTAIDISETALARAQQNASLNNLNGQIRFENGDMFDYLRQCDEKHQQFDVVNLDPPAFAKNRKSARKAMRGYKDLHSRAFKVIKPGGILTTSSCSYHVSEMTFLDIINSSAQQVGRHISLLEWHGAAPDHPTLPAMPETKYLKFGVFRVE